MALGVSVAFGYGWGFNSTVYDKLTDEQKADVDQIEQQMLELRKSLVQKQVEYGIITEEQAQLALDRMELGFKYRHTQPADGQAPFGYGRMGGGFNGCWGGGYDPESGPMNNHMWGGGGPRGGRW